MVIGRTKFLTTDGDPKITFFPVTNMIVDFHVSNKNADALTILASKRTFLAGNWCENCQEDFTSHSNRFGPC